MTENSSKDQAKRQPVAVSRQPSAIRSQVPNNLFLTYIDFLLHSLPEGKEMNTNQLITLTEARAILGVSKTKIAQLVKEGQLNPHENPLDRREKLVNLKQVQALLRQVGGRAKSATTRRDHVEKLPTSLRGIGSVPPGVDLEVEIRKLRKRAGEQARKRLERMARMLDE
jgi:hypothetical protein